VRLTGVLRPWPLPAALALALLVPSLDQAGYTRGGRASFVALAGAALVVAIATEDRRVRASLRSAPALALAALACLSVISASWTLIRPADSLLWGLVIAGYCALAVSAAAFARGRGVVALAGMIVVVAVAEAALGVGAAALRDVPWAERIRGTWRAGGTLEYSSALALLEVAALPALLALMARARTAVAAGAAAAAVLAAGATVLARSRAELALAVLVAAIALIWPRATVRAPRGVVAAAIALVAGGAVAIHQIVGGQIHHHNDHVAAGPARVAWVVAVLAVAALCWPPARSYAPRLRLPAARAIRLALTVAAVGLAVAGLVAVTGSPQAGRDEARGGLAHGRETQWRAAWRSFLDRPAAGAGADAFLAASAVHQKRRPIRYAHDLPLETAAELGTAGLLAAIALYVAVGVALWRSRRDRYAWLVAPGVAAFMLANLVDWQWHLPLSGAIWALGLGAVVALAGTARADERGASP
jgi:O-antigen ligase